MSDPQTLDSSSTNNSDPQDSANSTSSDPQSLTRNSSFSKLNAKAPEFVPMKTQSPPNSVNNSSEPPRLMISPPPPPSPPAMLHVYPGPIPIPIPVQSPHLAPSHVHHHHHHGNHGHGHGHHHQHHHQHHHHNQNHHNHNQNNNQNKKHHQETGNQASQEKDQGQGQGQAQGQGNNGAPSKNGLSEEATQKLINQVEYYFSDVNLATTDHLIRFINKDPEGFVPISVVASFKKIKALITSNAQLASVLRNSTKLVVSEDGKKVKRLQPLTGSDMDELQARIIVAENLPEDHCHQNLMKIFSAVGSVKSIRTCLPQPSNNGATSASRPSKTDNMLYSNKLHAFVEYESVELAEKAIVELNDEDDWRNGLRVRLLHKRGSKPAQSRTKKAGNEGETTCEEEGASTSELNQNEKQSEDPSGQPEIQSHEHVEEQSLEKEGGQRKGRNRGRGKGRGRGQGQSQGQVQGQHHHQNHHHHHHQHHHHQPNRGHHVGTPPTNHAANGEPAIAKQQPPGPRMPDGTRGFSMGRGKPAQQGEVTMAANLSDPGYKFELASAVPSVGLPKATLKFPYGEVSLVEKEDEEEKRILSINGLVKGPILNGVCTALYKDEGLNLRYCYKDEELSFIPSISLPSNAISFAFKRRLGPSDKLSYWYNFDTNYWSTVYKHTVGKDYKFKAGYDSEVRLGWASLWVGDESGKAKTAPMKTKVQFMLQVPQDDIKSSVLMFRVKKRWDI